MDIEKAIEILSDAERGILTTGDEFKSAATMGRKALVLFAFGGPEYKMNDANLRVHLNATRIKQ